MPLTGPRRKDALTPIPVRRRTWRLSLGGLISLFVHATVLILLLVTVHREDQPELLPPPAPVTMLFESGRKSGPTSPEPSTQATPALPPAPPLAKTPPVEPAPTQPAPPPPAPPPVVQAPTPVEPTPPKPIQPQNPPPPPDQAPIPIPPPATAPIRPAPKPAPPKSSDFPAPMNFSFGKPPSSRQSRPQTASRASRMIDMSLGPASKGVANVTPYADRDEDGATADWRNALAQWVAEHAYYPPQAARDLEEGDAKVHVALNPSGRVTSVELIGRSGSQWLDLALLALFRDARLPPLPSGEREPLEFNFTMHYIIVRMR